ncbi:MAG: DUF4405 domain-containing protein [Ruminococcus sp.]|nr:DUF4405 domain-containing protein [Ruminococcus sp.]
MYLERNVIIKIFLDIAMIILYALLMFAQGLGGFFHETAGIGTGILFVIHVAMNYSMIKGLFKSVKNGTAKGLKLILLFSDILLAVCMPVVILTGIFIAKELFFIDSSISGILLFNIHNVLSYICLGIMILHIVLHAKYLSGVFKKIPSALSGNEMKSAVCRFSAGVFIAVILYSSLALNKNLSDKQNFSNEYDTSNNENSISLEPTEESYVITSDENSVSEIIEDNTVFITETPSEDSIITETQSPPVPTLEEYLSGLICTGCGKRCPLIAPRCRKGDAQAIQAEQEYNQLYSY